MIHIIYSVCMSIMKNTKIKDTYAMKNMEIIKINRIDQVYSQLNRSRVVLIAN